MKSSPNPPSNKSPQSDSSQESPAAPSTPLWETLIIAASFAGVWIYFFAWLAAGRAKAPLAPWWQLLLLPCLVALFIVFRRRLMRARAAVRESSEMRRPPF